MGWERSKGRGDDDAVFRPDEDALEQQRQGKLAEDRLERLGFQPIEEVVGYEKVLSAASLSVLFNHQLGYTEDEVIGCQAIIISNEAPMSPEVWVPTIPAPTELDPLSAELKPMLQRYHGVLEELIEQWEEALDKAQAVETPDGEMISKITKTIKFWVMEREAVGELIK